MFSRMRIAEQECFLRHEADVAPQRLQRVFAYRMIVDQNCALLCVVNARNQIDQGGLS